MSAQTNTLAALLAAAVVVTPAAAEAKGGKDRGAQGAGREQNRGGGGGGESRGGGKHREARQAPQAMDRPAPAPRQAFEGRGGRDKRREARQARQAMERVAPAPRQAFQARERADGKQARQERSARAERLAIEARQQREAAKPKRWERERQAQRAGRADFDARRGRGKREAASYFVDNRRDRTPQSSRKFEKQIARQQQAAYRAEAKRQRQWSRHQRDVLKQAVTVVPVVVYQQPFAGFARDVRYAYAPAYRAPSIRAFPAYPSYAAAYDYAPRYPSDEGYGNWSYPQSYSGWSEYPSYGGYAPYDAGFGNGGLGGLFGGGGGLGDILVALLPLLLGDSLGLGGLTGGALDTGFLGSSMPDFAGGDYAEPAYGYQDASVGQGLLGTDQGLLGGDGLMSLLPLALQSGLFGGGSGSFGGLPGLGGSLGLENALGFSNPDFGYAAPYSSDTGLLSGFGIV